MEQKIVLDVYMKCQKCRTEALKVAAKADGVVYYVGVEGEHKVVVKGKGVDVVKLVSSLRKKVGPTDIISLSAIP